MSNLPSFENFNTCWRPQSVTQRLSCASIENPCGLRKTFAPHDVIGLPVLPSNTITVGN